jgi:carbonic anhydrase
VAPPILSRPGRDLRDSIQRITESPFIPRKGEVRGFIYDVETGRLDEVS